MSETNSYHVRGFYNGSEAQIDVRDREVKLLVSDGDDIATITLSKAQAVSLAWWLMGRAAEMEDE